MPTWFHHVLRLRRETTAAQRQTILEQVTILLARYPRVEDDSIRVRFLRLNTANLGIEILAYLFARNSNHYRDMHQDLQLQVTTLLQRVGVRR